MGEKRGGSVGEGVANGVVAVEGVGVGVGMGADVAVGVAINWGVGVGRSLAAFALNTTKV